MVITYRETKEREREREIEREREWERERERERRERERERERETEREREREREREMGMHVVKSNFLEEKLEKKNRMGKKLKEKCKLHYYAISHNSQMPMRKRVEIRVHIL